MDKDIMESPPKRLWFLDQKLTPDDIKYLRRLTSENDRNGFRACSRWVRDKLIEADNKANEQRRKVSKKERARIRAIRVEEWKKTKKEYDEALQLWERRYERKSTLLSKRQSNEQPAVSFPKVQINLRTRHSWSWYKKSQQGPQDDFINYLRLVIGLDPLDNIDETDAATTWFSGLIAVSEGITSDVNKSDQNIDDEDLCYSNEEKTLHKRHKSGLFRNGRLSSDKFE